MSEVDYSSYSRSSEADEVKRIEQPRTAVKVAQPQLKPVVQPQSVKIDSIKAQLEALAVDSTLLHKEFGKSTVVKINKNEKFIHIKFSLGEKKFIFPDAFLMGFLEVE